MRPRSQHILLPESVAFRIADSGAAWGAFGARMMADEGLVVIDEYEIKEKGHRQVPSRWLSEHISHHAPRQSGIGFWYRADDYLHMLWETISPRRVSIKSDSFREHINGWRAPGNLTVPVITFVHEPPEGVRRWCGWLVNKEMATPMTIEIVNESTDIYSLFGDAWPLELLAPDLVTVIGVGSIGSATAEALLEYGIRRFALVDPDRLQFHNLPRHRLLAYDIGRLKVNAMKDLLAARDPEAEIHALALDVIEDADQLRGVFRQSSAVVVCSDGVASRRAANHLACWAGTPAIFGCVLEDGGIGEVIRVRPGVSACLTCYREALVERGSFDPEPSLDRGYGTGTRHLPMTAVGGDLDLVGKLAAKMTVATLLERRGYFDQRLPSDHAVLGLQPPPDLPEPFDVQVAGELKWDDTGRPRSGCPSCRAV
jgi:hypothetical protein